MIGKAAWLMIRHEDVDYYIRDNAILKKRRHILEKSWRKRGKKITTDESLSGKGGCVLCLFN